MRNFKLVLIILLGAVAVFLMGLFAINGVPNKAISLDEQIEVANADIKVQEKRRVDLIYNLVDVVKEYDKHEYQTLKDVVDARNSEGGDISEVTTVITATAEAYPELKSNENYRQLMSELSITENMIAQYRSNYNKQIKEYNRYIKKFPNKQILGFLGYEIIDHTYLDFDAPSDAPQNLFNKEG